MERKTSVFENGLIWFGAGVSLAEILTGTYLAPLGMGRGLAAILLGHLIGGVLFYLAAVISGETGKSSMDAVKMTYGQQGGRLFALLNVIQLAGWTAIMIYDGSLSAAGIFNPGRWLWCVVIGGLILVWILVGISSLGKLNTMAMAALFLLSIMLCVTVAGQSGASSAAVESISFGAALELSASMPLSWLPCVGDYTRVAAEPKKASLVSTLVYNAVSIWMFLIGMAAAIYAGTTDITMILLRAGLGAAGLLIVVFSTVTTTFLDAFSAGISARSISEKADERKAAVLTTGIGMVCAIAFPMDDITGFLYFIGSVFAPMAAVMIGTCYIRKTRSDEQAFDWPNLLVWLIGFVLYRLLMHTDLPCGYTLPDILITLALTLLAGRKRKNV